EIKGGLQNIFTGEGMDDHIPKGSPSQVEALLRVKDALGQYQKLPVQDHNLIALYEDGRPVFNDQYTLFCMAERLSSEKQNDLFRHTLGMFDTPGHGKKLATIDTLVKRGDCRNALEMLTILKLLADKSKNNAELYSTFGKKMVTTAIDIYCHFRNNWREYKDMSQWEYETLLWAATEAQLHPEGVVKRCKEEIGVYDPNVDPELPKL
ncbi:hypothetical protein KY326_04155, partial [Candidatus Woesearchaeota archaeon]|nr:hypothetical protein [Candidatus Woesearchaeota archaeon]